MVVAGALAGDARVSSPTRFRTWRAAGAERPEGELGAGLLLSGAEVIWVTAPAYPPVDSSRVARGTWPDDDPPTRPAGAGWQCQAMR